MSKFAIIQTGGKQYKVSVGTKLRVEKLVAGEGAEVSFDKVLLVADGSNVSVGTPYVLGAKVDALVMKQGRSDKVIVFKFHSKTRQHKKKGHRQHYTEVEVKSIG